MIKYSSYIIAVYLIFSVVAVSYSQSNTGDSRAYKVNPEDTPPSNRELKHSEISKRIDLMYARFNEAKRGFINSTSHLEGMNTTGGLQSVNAYEKKISDNLFFIQMIEKYNLDNIEDELNDLLEQRAKLTGTRHTPLNSYSYRIREAEKKIATLRQNMKNEDEKQQEKAEHNLRMEHYDKQLSELDKQLSNMTSESKEGEKLKSIDDFLSENINVENNNSTKDILASDYNPNKNSDFLASDSNNNSDPLSGSNESKKDFEIDYKNGKEGVINSSGRILIPYGNWKIMDYKSGIAKVVIWIDNYDSGCGEIVINKVGFVDKTGQLLDFYYNFFEDSEPPRLYLTYTKKPEGYDLWSWEKRNAYDLRQESKKRENERRKELEKKRCQIKKQEAIIYLKSKYRN